MKKLLFSRMTEVFALALCSSLLFFSCGKDKAVDISLVEDIPTIQGFTEDSVPESDIKKIVKAGINSQSAMNGQPWHFTVVTNKDVLSGISEKMKANMPGRPSKDGKKAPPAGDFKEGANDFPPPGMDGDKKAPPSGPAMGMGPKAAMGDSPVAIIVSAKDGSEYDAGLASQMMTLEAVLLGYGTKIISSPTIVLNGPDKNEYKKQLGIPENMSVKGIILVGKYDKSKADAVTGSTPRKAESEIVTFLK